MPRRGQPRPTLKHVATEAEVSLSTASIVFSGRGPVSPETAERVRAAAARLGYAGPDPLASSLRRGRAGTVGVVVEGRLGYAFRDPYAVSVLDGLAQELDAVPTAMLLVSHVSGEPGVADVAAHGPLGNALDAVVFPLCGPRSFAAVAQLAARGIPMVATGGPVGPGVTQLRVEERAASRAATDHLRQLGHRRLAHVTMPLTAIGHSEPVTPDRLTHAVYPDAAERARGFLDIAGKGAPVVEAAHVGVAEGESAGRLLLEVDPEERPTGIVAQSDLLAAGVIRAAESLGMRVPEDVSVTGFDGVELPWLDHELTTVVQTGEDKGRRLGSMVRRALDGEPVHDQTFEVHLRVGGTTGPPP